MKVGAAAAVALALVVAAPAAARTDVIRPGVGIGKVRLGMSEAQVRKALGRPSYVAKREQRGFGSQYLELGWDFAAWTVGFEGRAGQLRVVNVATSLASQRARKVGPGATVPAVVKAFPSVRCSDRRLRNSVFHGRWLTARAPNGRQTVFIVRYTFHSIYVETPPPGRVSEVVVGEPLGTDLVSSRCPAGWQRDVRSGRPLLYP
jgi:hypothetical protein